MEAHRVLGVARDASEEQIRKAYKALAMKWHPDRRLQEKEAATAKFVEINKASRTLLRNLRRPRVRRSPTAGSSLPADSPQSSPKSSPRSPPAALPKSDTFQSTRSSSQFSASSRSEPASSFSSFWSSSSPSLATTNSDHRGPIVTRPLTRDPSHIPTEPFPTRDDPVGSGLSSPKPNRLRKQLRPPSSRSSSDQWDFTPKRTVRQRNVSGSVVETLCPGRGILTGAGADSPKTWVHVLNMTLEELFHGKTFHFRILRYTRVGKKRVNSVDIRIPPGSHAGTEILLQNAGHEGKDGRYQDICFVIREKRHYRFTRFRDDLVMEVKLPWLDCLANDVGHIYLCGVDNKDYKFPIDYRTGHSLTGTYTIDGAGMPLRNGPGRGRIVVQWELEPPPTSSGWDSIKTSLGFKSRAQSMQ